MKWRNPLRRLVVASAIALACFAAGIWLDYALAIPGWKLHWLTGLVAILSLGAWAGWLLRGEQTRGLSHDDLRSLLNVTPEAVLVIDREARVTLANGMAARRFGYALEDLRALSIRELLPGYLDEAASEKVPSDSPSSTWRIRPGSALVGRRRDGSEFPSEISLSRLEIESTSYAICFVRDVSERKRMEEQARQSQKLEAVGRLAAGVAHDFNNVLTAIIGFSELLLEKTPADQPGHEGLSEIHKAGQRGVALTRQLLAFGRKQVLAPVPVNLNHLVTDMEKMLRRLIREDVHLLTDLDEHLHVVKVDPNQITQVIVNLVVNARDAMLQGGRIVVRTANADPSERSLLAHPELRSRLFCLLEVSDNGAGMDAETKAHLFEPFFTTKSKGKGTGLGLATVYGIVQQSAGHVEVDSAQGQGTTFRIYLPRFASTPSTPLPRTPVPSPSRTPRRSETILLAEDEQSVRTLARRILEQDGYRVLEAWDGAEAVRLSSAFLGKIDLLVTDLVMPGMDGRKLAHTVLDQRPDCHVVYSTGYASPGGSADELDLGSTEEVVLQKPFTPEKLLETVREAIAGRELVKR